MRIDPALPPPIGQQLAVPTEGEPGQTFGDFLGGGDAASGRAIGFAEFGIFGREEQAQSPAQLVPPSNPPLQSSAAFLPVESLDEPLDCPAAPSPDPATSAIEPGQRPIRAAPTPEARPHARTAAAIPPADPGPGFSVSEPASGDEHAPSAASPATRRAQRAPPPQSDVSLIMRETDGGVELAAAGPALDSETCALLRKLIRTILAHNGLDLVQFHLNGAPIAPDSRIMTGGSHGTRTG